MSPHWRLRERRFPSKTSHSWRRYHNHAEVTVSLKKYSLRFSIFYCWPHLTLNLEKHRNPNCQLEMIETKCISEYRTELLKGIWCCIILADFSTQCFLTTSLILPFTHTHKRKDFFTPSHSSASMRGSLGFSVLPEDTSACRGFNHQPWLVDDLLLSHSGPDAGSEYLCKAIMWSQAV